MCGNNFMPLFIIQNISTYKRKKRVLIERIKSIPSEIKDYY